MSDKIAMVIGSFDPITKGHLDIIKRASGLFDKLYVGLFYNKDKQGFFSVESRRRMLEETLSEFDNVSLLAAHDSLAVDMARQLNVSYLVRGLRSSRDFAYEANLDYFNKALAPDIETVYLLASHDLQPISSSRVRELIHFRADISSYVPEAVVKEVEKNCDKKQRI